MIHLIPLQESLTEQVAAKLVKRKESPDSILMVVPSRRMRVFLLNALGRHFSGSFFPPRILTVDGFFNCLHHRLYPVDTEASELESAIAMDGTLNHTFPKGGYGGPPGAEFLDRYPRVRRFLNALEECLVEGAEWEKIDRDVFSRYVELGDYHREYREFLTQLPHLTEDYVRRLARAGKASRGMIYSRVAEASEKGEVLVPRGVERIVFVGLTALNRSEQRVLARMFKDFPAELFIRTDAVALEDPDSPFSLQKETVTLLGGSPEYPSGKSTSWNRFSGKVTLHPSLDRETMMAALFRELRDALAGCEDAEDLLRIGVVLPDPSALVPFIQGVVSRFNMRERNIPFNITLGYPFSRTPLFQLMGCMLNLIRDREGDRIPASRYLDLLRHPYVKISGGDGERDLILRRALHHVESWIQRENRMHVTLTELETEAGRMEGEGGALAREALAAMHRRFVPGDTGDLDSLCGGLREGIRALREEKGYLFLTDTVDMALSALEELREFIRDSGEDPLRGSLRARTAFIHNYLGHREIRFQGSPLEGIQVMGLLEFRGLSFDRVFVLDAVEGVLPGNRKHDALLPRDVRAALGIRQHTDWERLFAVDFFSLTAASRVDVFWSEDAGWAPAHRSRFIERMILEVEKQGEAPLPETRFNLRFVPPEIHLARIHKDETIREKLNSMAFSPSALETYLHCPLQFYFQRILGLDVRERLEADPDAGELGSLLHQALFRFYGGEKPAVPESADLESRLQSILEREYRDRGFDPDSGIGRMRMWMFQRRLMAFVTADIASMNETGTRLLGLEMDYRAEILVAGLDKPVPLMGRCDRVEKEGILVRVVDYKSGGYFSPRSRDGIPAEVPDLHLLAEGEYKKALARVTASLKGFQLYAYMLMLQEKDQISPENLLADYVFLRETDEKNRRVPVFKSSLSQEDRCEQIRRFRLHLDALIRDIFLRPEFLPIPNESHCQYCPFRTPCGNI